MRRLLQYMKPYKWRVVLALVMVAIVTPLELAPPLIFRKAIDWLLCSRAESRDPGSIGMVGHRLA